MTIDRPILMNINSSRVRCVFPSRDLCWCTNRSRSGGKAGAKLGATRPNNNYKQQSGSKAGKSRGQLMALVGHGGGAGLAGKGRLGGLS